MADLTENIVPMDFHPCDTPRGMSYYNMDVLTEEQQRRLNVLKIETLRENEKYLASHPEIRACVALITRVVLTRRPRTNIHEVIAEYFSKSKLDIEIDVHEYLNSRGPHVSQATSGLNLYTDISQEYIYEDSVANNLTEKFDYDWPAPEESSMVSFPSTSTPILENEYTLQSDSLKNIAVDYKSIRKVSSSKIVHSISIITQQTADDEEELNVDAKVKIEPSKKPKKYIKKQKPASSPSDEKYVHPDLFEDRSSTEILEYLEELTVADEEDENVHDKRVTPSTSAGRQLYGRDSFYGSKQDQKKKTSIRQDLNQEKILEDDNENENDMTALMERRSVRISAVAPKELLQLDEEGMQKSSDPHNASDQLHRTSSRHLSEERQALHIHLNEAIERHDNKPQEGISRQSLPGDAHTVHIKQRSVSGRPSHTLYSKTASFTAGNVSSSADRDSKAEILSKASVGNTRESRPKLEIFDYNDSPKSTNELNDKLKSISKQNVEQEKDEDKKAEENDGVLRKISKGKVGSRISFLLQPESVGDADTGQQ